MYTLHENQSIVHASVLTKQNIEESAGGVRHVVRSLLSTLAMKNTERFYIAHGRVATATKSATRGSINGLGVSLVLPKSVLSAVGLKNLTGPIRTTAIERIKEIGCLFAIGVTGVMIAGKI